MRWLRWLWHDFATAWSENMPCLSCLSFTRLTMSLITHSHFAERMIWIFWMSPSTQRHESGKKCLLWIPRRSGGAATRARCGPHAGEISSNKAKEYLEDLGRLLKIGFAHIYHGWSHMYHISYQCISRMYYIYPRVDSCSIIEAPQRTTG